jgi:hypothetical protein
MKSNNRIRLYSFVRAGVLVGVLGGALAGATLSCATQRQPEPSSQISSASVTITGSDQTTYTSVAPVELKATFGATPSFMLTIQGNSAAEGWSVTAMLTAAQAVAGRADLYVGDTPIGEGIANVTHVRSEGTREQVARGTLSFTVTGGRISGTVTATPVELGASMSGASSVSCWVPRSATGTVDDGAVQQGTVSTGVDEALVEDKGLVSAPCSTLKAWRHD